MSKDDEKEWSEFRVEILKSKFKGAPTEAQLLERLKAMVARRNTFAIRAARTAKMLNTASGKLWPTRFWEKGALYNLYDIQMPHRTGPAGTDEAGLWRPHQWNRKR